MTRPTMTKEEFMRCEQMEAFFREVSEHPQWEEKHWDFSVVKKRYFHVDPCAQYQVGDLMQMECNSAACGIGWLPAVFPRLVGWGGLSSIYLKSDSSIPDWAVVKSVFGITEDEVHQVFYAEAGERTILADEIADRLRNVMDGYDLIEENPR